MRKMRKVLPERLVAMLTKDLAIIDNAWLTSFVQMWRPGSRSEKKQKIGRNDPCPCGSGKKYKKCCGR